MLYPRYHDEVAYKNRMMSPLISLRIGELFGNSSKMQHGFIETMNFTWPDLALWETNPGMRVPRECDVNISFRVLHRSPPSYDTPADEFFGVNYN